MSVNDAATWTDRLVPAVPGLAALAYGFTLPDELQPLFRAGLSVVLFSTFAIVLLSRGKIRRWSIHRSVRWIAVSTVGALASLFLFFAAQASLVRADPSGSDSTGVMLIPTRVRLLPPEMTFPYGDCREVIDPACDAPVAREAGSSDDVVNLLTTHGDHDIRLSSSAFTSKLILFALYVAAAVQLIFLFGVVTMRRITPGVILKEFEQAGSPGSVQRPGSHGDTETQGTA